MIRAIRKAIKTRFSSYILWDDCGTCRYCWDMAEAMEWLPYAGSHAAIINRQTRIIEVSRHQTRAY